MFAAIANNERTSKAVERTPGHRQGRNTPSTMDTIPDNDSGMFPSFGEFGLSSVTNSRCALAVEGEFRSGITEMELTR